MPLVPVHPAMSSCFPLLEGVPSMQALMEDPQYAQVRDELGPIRTTRRLTCASGPMPRQARTARCRSGSTTTALRAPAGARAWSGCMAAPSSPGTSTCPKPMREVPAMLQFPPAAMSAINVNYLGGPVSEADGYAFPALADLRGLCPTLVLNAEYDDLRGPAVLTA
jgi:hypothetical protein